MSGIGGRRECWSWKHVIRAERHWTCKYCHEIHTGGAERVRAHLAGVRARGVKTCKAMREIPYEVLKNARSSFSDFELADPADADDGHLLQQAAQGSGGPAESMVASTENWSSAGTSRAAKRRSSDGNLVTFFDTASAEALDDAVAEFFFAENISFNTIRRDNLKRMLKVAAKVGRPAIDNLMGYEKLRTTELQRIYNNVQKRLEDVRLSWRTYGCTIVTDGWSDIKKRSLINFMVSSVRGSIFLKAVDSKNAKKTGAWLFEQLKQVIAEVGAENVVQVVTDNASNCVVMGELLQQEFPQIVHVRCICHVMDLLFEDIGALSWVQPFVDGCAKIVTFITSKPRVLALYRTFCKRDLIKPVTTRFAYIFLVMSQLLETTNLSGLRRMVNLLILLGPLLRVLRLADREGATSGLIFEAVDLLIEKMDEGARNGIYAHEEVGQIKDFLLESHGLKEARWYQMHNVIHGAAFALHPLFLGDNSENDKLDNEAHGNWLEYMHVYSGGDLDLQLRLQAQFERFRQQLGRQMRLPVAKDRETRKFPVTWWSSFGLEMPDLRRMALRILSQVVCASPCERNWSSWSLIQTKRRSRLLPKNAEKLVYIHTNLRVVQKLESEGLRMLEIDIDKLELEPHWKRILDLQEAFEEPNQAADEFSIDEGMEDDSESEDD
ncbi:uncharacterized protein LOC112341331 [Selaginella moellendorffii]|uniref:uncharacterized protein LOC112341331 n=1 Tax=Selaginella moellendorffii TaxID=88036 RepID=UPI000D1C7CE8|nr:uncharacterized protein LOC112341331 [Selaginella moellendorffii]|eukprot:XP_024517030.1 uncharacterized protein LOC112341331 [Selaginella moellendorffii]